MAMVLPPATVPPEPMFTGATDKRIGSAGSGTDEDIVTGATVHGRSVSRSARQCINEDVIVPADTDIAKVERIINQVGQELTGKEKFHKSIIEAPNFSRVDGFVTNGMIVKVLGKVVDGEQWEVKGEFYRMLRKAFDKEGISLIQTQHVHVAPSKRK